LLKQFKKMRQMKTNYEKVLAGFQNELITPHGRLPHSRQSTQRHSDTATQRHSEYVRIILGF
jgi:hypothetical protein